MNISQWQHYLLQEMEEDLSLKQQNIAKQTKPVDKITGSDFKALQAKKKAKKAADMEEGEDHEVSMANNSLESIIKAAMELKVKLGDNEKDIPAWIQDHITNAANFISQAAENYHEYGEEDIEDTSLSSLMENKTNDKEASKVEKALSTIKTGSRAKMILDDGKTITMERIGTSKSGEPTFKHVDKDGKLKGSASTVSASHIKSVKPINK